MSVKVIGLDSFIGDLGLAAKATKKVIETAALAAATEVRRLAMGKVPKRSTALARSIIAEPITYGAMTTVNEKYGIYVEQGTGLYDPRGAHLIYPKTAQAMVWEDGGQKYGARWTRGMEAQPFFQPAIDEAEPYVVEQMITARDLLIKTAVGAV